MHKYKVLQLFKIDQLLIKFSLFTKFSKDFHLILSKEFKRVFKFFFQNSHFLFMF